MSYSDKWYRGFPTAAARYEKPYVIEQLWKSQEKTKNTLKCIKCHRQYLVFQTTQLCNQADTFYSKIVQKRYVFNDNHCFYVLSVVALALLKVFPI